MMEHLPPPQEPRKEDITDQLHHDFARLRRSLGKFFKKLIDPRPGMDREGTVKNIQENKRMQGANAWLLMCSIVVASLGLDLNSPAVIIGAMLISPLMSPIIGIGFGIATNDRETLSTSGRHFGVAIGIALIASTAYFFITPFGQLTSEILSRTEPTFLDVLVALFGGIAGIISLSREDKSNAIPGVAIATALMPPLCVTGFGLAKGARIMLGFEDASNFEVWPLISNSFYLFFLNSFFVAIATFIIVRFVLHFPFKRYIDMKTRRRTMTMIIGISLIMIIPSFFLMVPIIKKLKTNKYKQDFITQYIGDRAKYLDDSQIVETSSGRTLILKVYGSAISMADSTRYLEGLKEVGLTDTDIEIIPSSEIDLSSFKLLQSEIKNVHSNLQERLDISRETQLSKDAEIEKLQQQLDSLRQTSAIKETFLDDLKILFDDLEQLAFAPNSVSRDSIGPPMLMLRWQVNKPLSERRSDQAKINALCKKRGFPEDLLVVSN